MPPFNLSATTDADGNLNLVVPVGLSNSPVDVLVVVQPRAAYTPEDRGWPPGFFERTVGGWQGGIPIRE